MPEVSGPSDGGYNYYQKKLSDLEEELRTDAKKGEKRSQERVDDLGKKYDADRVQMEENFHKSADNIKSNAQDSIDHDREFNRAEVNRIKANTYDRFGRSHGLEADVLKSQLEDLQRTSESRYRKDDSSMKDAQSAYNQRLEEATKNFDEKLDQGVQNAHDSAMEHYDRAFGEEKDQYLQFKKDAETSTAELDHRRMDDMNNQRRQYESALAESKRDYDRRLGKANQSNDTRYHNTERKLDRDAENATRALNDSHAGESNILREQIQDLAGAEGRYVKERGQGKVDAVNEYEGEWRTREDTLANTYGLEIDKLKQDNDSIAKYYTRQNDTNLKEKDQYFTKLLNRLNAENHLAKQDIQSVFMKDRDQMEIRQKKDRELATHTLESQLGDANRAKDDALENQAKAYQQTISRNQESDSTEIRALEKALQTAKTSEDTNLISPAAEASVRKAVVHQYEKTAAQDDIRNREKVDSIQKNLVTRMQEAVAVEQDQKAYVVREDAERQTEERAKFLEAATDQQFMHNTETLNKQAEHQKDNDNMTRSYSSMLNRQRQQFDNTLAATTDDAAVRSAGIRQQADFDLKVAQRAFNARQNELIRDHDKKLADQRADYESRLDSLKTTTAHDLREGERRNRLALDQMQQSYEQRLAQMEYSHKERERYQAQNSEEELEKVRRSNALLIQKKS